MPVWGLCGCEESPLAACLVLPASQQLASPRPTPAACYWPPPSLAAGPQPVSEAWLLSLRSLGVAGAASSYSSPHALDLAFLRLRPRGQAPGLPWVAVGGCTQ